MNEATKSSSKFFAILNELVNEGDEDALLNFLSYCNIPLLFVSRSPVFSGRPVWEGREGMRSLGERNLRICQTLHEATLNFFDRHLRKLRRHCESLEIEGVSNYMHIFLSMAGLIQMQIDRIVVALESRVGNVSTEEWKDCRTLWDVYLSKFKELMNCLWDDYLKRMAVGHNRSEVQSEFGDDLDSLGDVCEMILTYRERIEKIRFAKCLMQRPRGQSKPYGYFESILASKYWLGYAQNVQMRWYSVQRTVAGTITRHGPHIPSYLPA